MKTKTRKIHYCEHCKKHLHRKPSMEYHEKHCTGNIDRDCGLCGRTSKTTPTLRELVERFKQEMFVPKAQAGKGIPADQIKKPKLVDIMDEVGYCPLCTLAIIRGCGLQHYPYYINFQYEEEMNKWWKAEADEEHRRECASIAY